MAAEDFDRLYHQMYSEGGTYHRYFSKTRRLLEDGRVPWLGWEQRQVLLEILRVQPRQVVELGASLGQTAAFLKRRGVSFRGFEFDKSTAEEAARLGFAITQGDHRSLRSLTSTCDAIVAFEVLEHVPDIGECLVSVRSALRNSGLLGITVPNFDRRLNGANPESLGQDAPPIHVNFWTASSLATTLRRFHLEPLYVRTPLRPNIDFSHLAKTGAKFWKALRGRFHGPSLVCVARKVS